VGKGRSDKFRLGLVDGKRTKFVLGKVGLDGKGSKLREEKSKVRFSDDKS